MVLHIPIAPSRRPAPARPISRRPPAPVELAEARVDLDAIASNTRCFTGRAAGASLMAVVKADAFGHGAVPVARMTLAAGASWLGVARLREGLALRAAGIGAPVLAWLLEPACLRAAIAAGIDVSASSVEDLEAIAAAAGRGLAAEVHLKLDTGLHRAGTPLEAWPGVVARAVDLERRGRLHVRAIWSHLAHGDMAGDARNLEQQAALAAGIAMARALGLDPELTHLANSGGVVALGAAGCSMVRVGAGLYGIDVLDGGVVRSLRPAMTLSARVIGVRAVGAGEGVGYGAGHITTRSTRLALVPVGYADGLPRIAGDRASMAVAGRRVPVAGRISMDQAILDVGDLPVRVGDAVTVFGDGTDGAPTAADWATWAGTIPHEILTGIGSRVPRLHVGTAA